MSKVKICVDAGHVGSNYNQSPVVKTYFESEAMWKLHLLLKAELKKKGFEVITTRAKQEKDLGVYQRGTAAKGSMCSYLCTRTLAARRALTIRSFIEPMTISTRSTTSLSLSLRRSGSS